MALEKPEQTGFCRFVRLASIIAGLLTNFAVMAENVDPLELERAVQLETAAGDTQGAERIYKRIILSTGGSQRSRAEATFRLADLYSRQAKNNEAKSLFLQLLRDFPESLDLIPLAELELMKVTALLTRDLIGSDVASMQHLGDLAISLLGALENNERERATELLTSLNTSLEGLASGGDAPDVLKRLRTSSLEITATLHSERGGIEEALKQLRASKDFAPFLERGFPSDPHDVFAPAWRRKDRLSRSLAENNAKRAEEHASNLERYLAPIAALPSGMQEGALARLTLFAVRDAREFAKAGKFAEARKRLDEFDTDRHEQFGDFKLIGTLLTRTPDVAVSAAWVVLHRIEHARRELSRRAYASAMDHVSEAALVCKQVLPHVENEVADIFKRQQGQLEKALWEIKNDRLGAAFQALKAATEKSK